MPLVFIQHTTDRLSRSIAERLAPQMPLIVAQALDASEQEGIAGRLTWEDVEVRCQDSGEFDVNAKNIEIVILAHDFPSRRATLEERKDQIVRAVRRDIDAFKPANKCISGFVWVLLQPTAFGTL